jgi:FkbM family methyltransferase
MMVVPYASCLEDLRLYRALKQIERGFYIDVGAQHPAIHSVTKIFYDRGWRGINIEPSPRWFAGLVSCRPRDTNLRVAAAAAAGVCDFHEIADSGLSTMIAAIADRHVRSGFKARSSRVKTRPLAEICEEHVSGDIHFLKIDVEGAEKAVIEGCDFKRFRPWVILVEAVEPLGETPTYAAWEPLLLDAGYDFCTADPLNRWYVARERRGPRRTDRRLYSGGGRPGGAHRATQPGAR